MTEEFAFVNEKRVIEEIDGVSYETVYTSYRSTINPKNTKVMTAKGVYDLNNRIETASPNEDVIIPEYISPEQDINVIDTTQINKGDVIIIDKDKGIIGRDDIPIGDNIDSSRSVETIREEIIPENLNSYWSKI